MPDVDSQGPWWLWPAATVVAVATVALTIGFEPHLGVSELIAAALTVGLGLAARRWWPFVSPGRRSDPGNR